MRLPALTPHAVEFTAGVQFDSNPDAWHPAVLEGDAWALYSRDHPVAPGAFDAGVWAATPAVRLGRLRLRVQLEPGGPWSPASEAVTVPLPAVAPEEPQLGAPSAAMMTLAMGENTHRFNAGDIGSNNTTKAHAYLVPVLGAYAGLTNQVGGRTPTQYAIDQINEWDKFLPHCYGGIRGQREFWVCAVAVAKRTPAIWNALGAQVKARIDAVMEAQLYALMWQMSDRNHYIVNGGSQVTIRGDAQWGRGNNPNFTLPGFLAALIISAYFGGAAVVNAMLVNYDHAAFVARLTALRNAPGGAGMEEVLKTFRDLGPGVTPARLATAFRSAGGGAPTIFGFGLAQVDELVAFALAQKMWTKVIVSGCEAWRPDVGVPKGFTRPANGTFGIFEPVTIAGRATPGRGAVVGCLPPGAPPHPLLGQLGMAHELNSKDGGQNGSGGSPRSAMKYAWEGAVLVVAGVVTLLVYNALNRNHAPLIEALGRQRRGMACLNFRDIHGHRDISKGGRSWAGATAGGIDWGPEEAAKRLYSLPQNIQTLMIQPWVGAAA